MAHFFLLDKYIYIYIHNVTQMEALDAGYFFFNQSGERDSATLCVTSSRTKSCNICDKDNSSSDSSDK